MRTLLAIFGGAIGLLLAAPLVLLATPFWVVARLTAALARRIEPRAVPWRDLMEFAPVVGWKPRPNLDTHGFVEDVFHVVTDADGWRGRTRLDESEVVVIGDSFAFGQGIDEAAFFANLTTQPRIKAIGANGYNMVQELLWMKRLAPQLAGKVVVWMIYHGNDLYENLQPNLDHYRMPFVRQVGGGWEVVTSHVSAARWTTSRRRDYYQVLAEICSPTTLSERAFSACDYLLERGQDVCVQAGARLAVVTVPEPAQVTPHLARRLAERAPRAESFDPRIPDQRIGGTCRQLGVPFLALGDHLDAGHYKSQDVHWNPRGHRRVAEVIEQLYHGLDPLPARTEGLEPVPL